MLKVKYEQYISDYNRKMLEKEFRDLSELENWIFDQMQQDYTQLHCMYFPTPEKLARIKKAEPSAIKFTPVYGGPCFWIREIQNECQGIIFSDGTFTANQKHWNKTVQQWLSHCEERRIAPRFNFVGDEEQKDTLQRTPERMQAEKVILNLETWANGDSCDGCPTRDDTVFQAIDLLRQAYLN